MVKTPRGGSGYEEEKQGKTKGAWGEGTLSWAFRGALGLYFFLETEATEKFMHEGLRSDLPLEVADATREQ